MPLYTITTSKILDELKKKKIIYKLTDITINELNILPDKIQVIIQEIEKFNLGKAGISVSDKDFSSKSRIIDWNTKKTYYNKSKEDEDILIIELDIWNNFNILQKSKLAKQINDFFKKILNIYGDNILLIIRNLEPENWFQNGISGMENKFIQESRNRQY